MIIEGLILSIIFTLSFLFSSLKADVIYSASCAREDVQSAIDMAQDGDTVMIPEGESVWDKSVKIGEIISWTPIVYSGKAITVMGAGIDRTVIIAGISESGRAVIPFVIRTEEGKPFRITGMTIRGLDGSTVNPSGAISVRGTTKHLRIDHIKFENLYSRGILINGWMYGVIDHCEFIFLHSQSVWVGHSEWRGKLYGDGSWASPLSLGTEKAIYVEDNLFDAVGAMGEIIDGSGGSRYVFRYNTVINGEIGNHGTESPGRRRSCFSYEVYNNTISRVGTPWWAAMHFRGGTGVIFNNTVTGLYNNFCILSNYRDFHSFRFWGAADGTSPYDVNDGIIYERGVHTGSDSSRVLICNYKNWVENQWRGYSLHNLTTGKSSIIISNTDTSITTFYDPYAVSLTFNRGDIFVILRAYPCIDQIGRSTGDLLYNYDPPLPQRWPEQALEPLYEWNNTLNGEDADMQSRLPHIVEGRDFYNDTKRPGYTPFIYPHPLATERGWSIHLEECGILTKKSGILKDKDRVRLILPEGKRVDIAAYNVAGQKVAVFINKIENAEVSDIIRNRVSGVYFIKVKSRKFKEIRKILIIK